MQKALDSKVDKYINEVFKCQNDIFYFITTYCRDYTLPNYPRITKIHKKQEYIINTFLNDHYVIVMGSRQTGKTMAAIWILSWLTLFYPNYKSGVLSRKAESSFAIITEVKNNLMNLRKPFAVDLRPGNTKIGDASKSIDSYLQLKNNSDIRAITVQKDKPEEAGRGFRFGTIFVDEVAFITDIEKVMSGIENTTNRIFISYEKLNYPYGIILASTPNGTVKTGKYFYQQWTMAEASLSKYKSCRFHWSEVPEYTQEWFAAKTKGLSPRTIAQEYDLVFLGSNESFFSDDTIKQLQDESLDKEAKAVHLFSNYNLSVFKEFESDRVYLIGIDSATLYGADLSAIEVIDFETCEQIAEFIGKCSVTDLITILERIVRLYPTSLLIPESNSLGNQIIEYLANHPTLKKQLFKQEIKDVNRGTVTYKYGLQTTAESRPVMIEELYTQVSSDVTKLYSRALKLQLVGLENKNGKIEGQPDDAVMALAFTYFVRKRFPHAVSSVRPTKSSNIDFLTLYKQRYNVDDDKKEMNILGNLGIGQTQNIQSDRLFKTFETLFLHGESKE
ncbi:MAG: hypothetical protein QXI16_04435 [Sulfolobaceae archaeon]